MFTKTASEGLLIKQIRVYKDRRGIFLPTINNDDISEAGGEWEGLKLEQTNIVYNNECVIRGMHLQRWPFAQAKVISVVKGAIRDVVIDLRIASKTFGKQFFVDLSSTKANQLWVPTGFAHGYEALLPNTIVMYTILGSIYQPEFELCITPLDRHIWTIGNIDRYNIDNRDKQGQKLDDVIRQIQAQELII
jgi:dTDP-4-dehydrorhamnose 3,5-epimerase